VVVIVLVVVVVVVVVVVDNASDDVVVDVIPLEMGAVTVEVVPVVDSSPETLLAASPVQVWIFVDVANDVLLEVVL